MASLDASDNLNARTGIIRSASNLTAALFWALLIFNGFLFLRQGCLPCPGGEPS